MSYSVTHFWNVYQGDKWIAEIVAGSPSEAVQAVLLEHGLKSSEGMKAIEYDPDVNDPHVRFVPYGHDSFQEHFDEEHLGAEENLDETTMNTRHRYARGPVTDRLKQKLLLRLQQGLGDSDLLAEDIIELIAVARNDQDGFRAATQELDRLIGLTPSV
ncbi:hypothetical protein [Pseudomonas syringae]|uniref:hypothetical protein n=1 Tax=Pseudomonas syringae TaxID=317 RepID=UPI0024676DF3|nr:hypothetical protein [Pseudomonas syringae]MDH4602477.1 hypothetical protein [Pseudomonas syringae pv. papulans]